MGNCRTLLAFGLSVLILSSGCVSKKEYEALLSSKARTDRENIRLAQVEEDCQETLRQLNQTLSSLENTEGVLNDYKSDLEGVTVSRDSAFEVLEDLYAEYEGYRNDKEGEVARMEAWMQITRVELQDKAKMVRLMEEAIFANVDNLDKRRQVVRAVDVMMALRQERLDSLRNIGQLAVLGLNPDFTSIDIVDGNVVMSLSNTVLFSPGTPNLTEAGLSAITKLGQDVGSGPPARITVIGDPKDVPLANQEGDLQAQQVYTIMRELTNNGATTDMLMSTTRSALPDGDDQISTQIILTPEVDDFAAYLQGG